MTLVEVEAVAARLGLDATALTPAQLDQIEAAIEDSEARVEMYLARPLIARTEVVTGLYPSYGYDLSDYRAWPQVAERFDDRYDVVAVAPAADGDDGRFDVTFSVGIDVAGDPEFEPILRFIRQDATAGLRADPTLPGVARLVKTVSADGQSVTYDAPTGADAAGAAMTLAVLNRWRRRAAYQRRSVPLTPWPYYSGYGG